MRVIAFVTQKGGTGKSSLAVSLAVAAQEGGRRVTIIDLDPQGTAGNWYQRREAETPLVAALEPRQLVAALAGLAKQKCDLVIIDTAGVDAPGAAEAMKAADLCIIPARPSVADIEASRPTIRTLAKLDRQFAFVLNQCQPGKSTRNSDAFRALQLSGTVCGVTLATRVDHLDALATGTGVTERDPSGAAAGEIRELLLWINQRMERTSHEEKARVA